LPDNHGGLGWPGSYYRKAGGQDRGHPTTMEANQERLEAKKYVAINDNQERMETAVT
jgi:hypothetical protein